MIEIIPLKESVNKEITIPGSKSYTNRALILAALTKGKVKVKNALFSDDTEAMLGCLEGFVINIEKVGNDVYVDSDISQVKESHYELNAHLSGTTIRFILALSCIVPGVKILYGDESLNKRPIKDLVDCLKQLGADIEYLNEEGHPPLKINSSRLNPGKVSIKGGISSQFISALLMIAPKIGNVEINVENELLSKPYIDMTIDAMEKFGVKVNNENFRKFIIDEGGEYKAAEYLVEGDFSSASYFLAIAALTKSTLTLKNLNADSKQADRRFVDILEDMGNEIRYGENELTIIGKGIKAVEVDLRDFPDTTQTLAVLAAFAEGVTKITGIKSLRVKETERVKALENELSKMGIKTEVFEDSITIYGGDPKGAMIETYNDHRMAMAFAIAGAKIEGMKIKNPEVVKKTFPDFWEKIKSIGIGIKKS